MTTRKSVAAQNKSKKAKVEMSDEEAARLMIEEDYPEEISDALEDTSNAQPLATSTQTPAQRTIVISDDDDDFNWSTYNAVGGADDKTVISVADLKLDTKYPITSIRKVTDGAVSIFKFMFYSIIQFSFIPQVILQSDDFGIFLPKRLAEKPIPSNVRGRYFIIEKLHKCKNGKITPLMRFGKFDSSDDELNQ